MDGWIGDPLTRFDAPLKVGGGARYSAEIPLPGLSYAVLVPATIASGRIVAIDERWARSAQGVLAVISFRNSLKLQRPKFLPAGQSLPILQGPDIHYAGQPIAVVVADTFEHATHAASLVALSYDAQTPAADIDAALASAYQPEKIQSGSPAASRRGNFETGLQQAEVSISAVYRTPFEHHNPMEPHATVAAWDADGLTVYESTQGVANSQQALAQIFGIDPQQVRVISHFLGGGFGCKGQNWPHTSIAAMAAKQVGRPVKLVLTRPQMFSANGHRPATIQSVQLGANRSGRLTAIRHDSVNHTSLSDDFVEPAGSITEYLYSCQNVDVRHRIVRLNTGTPTFTRAPGFSSGSFALECAMDELAHRLQMDPIALRLANFAERDEHEDRPWSSNSLRLCYAQGAAHFGWERRPATPGSRREGHWQIGYGMAAASYPAHFRPAKARAIMRPNGEVLVQCGTQDIGTGTYTVLAQVAAQALAVPVERVRVELGDTRLPVGPGSGGSSTAAAAGSAVHLAALALRNKLVAIAIDDPASPLHDAPANEVDVIDGRMPRRGASSGESYQALLV